MSDFDIVDSTFREGAQSPLLFERKKFFFTLEEKKSLIKEMIFLGIRRFEFFTGIVGEKERDDFLEIKKFAKSLSPEVKFYAHCRLSRVDIDCALQEGFDGLHLYLNLSSLGKTQYSRPVFDLVKEAKKIISSLRESFSRLYLRFSCEDAFRTEISSIKNVFDQIAKYVDCFGLPDTVGLATPLLVKKRIKWFKKRYRSKLLEVHFHNDRGLSLINALAAIDAGANLVDTTIWGIGERNGITSLGNLLVNLYLEKRFLIKKFNLERCFQVNQLMKEILKFDIPYGESISKSIRTHIAGVHQNAVLKNKNLYEGIPWEIFGVKEKSLLPSYLSGSHFIHYFLNQILNYQISFDQAKKITKIFKEVLPKSNQTPEELLIKIADQYLPRKNHYDYH